MARKDDPDSVEAQLRELGPDEEDLALLNHIFDDDRPPQGLHRGGYREPTDDE